MCVWWQLPTSIWTQAIAEGRFREDLYYRLNTVPIQIPPLRERGDDVLLLFRKFSADFAEKYRMPAIQLTEDAKKELLAYPWPGNVRQLKNITGQISIIETNREICCYLAELSSCTKYATSSRVDGNA